MILLTGRQPNAEFSETLQGLSFGTMARAQSNHAMLLWVSFTSWWTLSSFREGASTYSRTSSLYFNSQNTLLVYNKEQLTSRAGRWVIITREKLRPLMIDVFKKNRDSVAYSDLSIGELQEKILMALMPMGKQTAKKEKKLKRNSTHRGHRGILEPFSYSISVLQAISSRCEAKM